jgi:hypothetical protein
MIYSTTKTGRAAARAAGGPLCPGCCLVLLGFQHLEALGEAWKESFDMFHSPHSGSYREPMSAQSRRQSMMW